jgi:hypothetical protein
VLPGPHADPEYITTPSMEQFYALPYKVHYNSNRCTSFLFGVATVGCLCEDELWALNIEACSRCRTSLYNNVLSDYQFLKLFVKSERSCKQSFQQLFASRMHKQGLRPFSPSPCCQAWCASV